MAYHGRIAGFGATKKGEPVALYAVSGRSEDSKKRVLKKKKLFKGVRTKPLGKLTPEQRRKRDIYIYNAMRVPPLPQWTNSLYEQFIVVSNGYHTDMILDEIMKEYMKGYMKGDLFQAHHMERVLNEEGAEPDKLRTPRIAGVYNPLETIAYLGIIRADSKAQIESIPMYNIKGLAKAIATYSGKNDESPESFNIMDDGLLELEIIGEDPKEIVDGVYEQIDPRYIVGAAAAVWQNDKKWNFEIKNYHK
jgi:IMP cyclohydrolase